MTGMRRHACAVFCFSWSGDPRVLHVLPHPFPTRRSSVLPSPTPGKPDLFVGTGGHGHTFPGASLPFGMAQLSPDTNTHGWDACSGYHQKDGSIIDRKSTRLNSSH